MPANEMCAGKLLTLIKKCLHREKAGQKCDCNGNGTGKPGQKSPPCTSKKPLPPGKGSSVPCYACHPQYNPSTRRHPSGPGASAGNNMDTTNGYNPWAAQRACSSGIHGGGAEHPASVPSHGHGAMTAHVGGAMTCCSHSCVGNPVVHLPNAAMDRLEREVALQRERHQRHQAIETDMQLNLPPRISISEDGEEGYEQSQRHLQQAAGSQHRLVGSIRPPPNKTVFSSCESPPPYRSNSVGKLDHGLKRGSRTSGLHHQSFPPACAVGSKHSHPSSSSSQQHQHQQQQACGANSSPFIPRCHSISSGDKRLPHYPSHHQSASVSRGHHSVLPSCGHTGRCHHSDATGGASTAAPCVNLDSHVGSHVVFGSGGVPSHGQFHACSHQSGAASGSAGTTATSPRATLSVQVPPYCAANNSHVTVVAPTNATAPASSSSSSSHLRDFDPPPDYSQAMRDSNPTSPPANASTTYSLTSTLSEPSV